MTLIASCFGVSSMGLSSICARSGILLYTLQLILAVGINYFSFYAFLFLTNHFKLRNFQDLSKLMLGRWQTLAIFSLILSNIGNMVGNLLIFIKYFQGILRKLNLLSFEPNLNENMIQILLISLFILPLVLKRQLKDIFFVTYITILIMVFFIFFVIFQFFITKTELDFDKVNVFHSNHFISNYSYLFFCFAGHQGIIIVYNENS